MPRYAAFLRGVSPMNAKMPEVKAAFEAAGFEDVKTLLSSGNVLFTAPRASESTLERKAEAAMRGRLGREFLTIVRPVAALREMLAGDPFAACRLPRGAKRVVTFLRRRPEAPPPLPVERDGARIVALVDRAAFTAYVATPRGAVFMTLIEKTFGQEVTTRTWDTLAKVAR